MSERERLLPTGVCWCGCGGQTKRLGSFFIQSHDRKAEAAVIRVEYGDLAHFVVEHGYGPGGKNAMQELEKLRGRQRAGE